MSESDANRMLSDTARVRVLPDVLEDTQRMPVDDRRKRMAQAYGLHTAFRNGHDVPGRERRRPHTVGERRPEYTPKPWQQAFIDFINDGSKHL